ncbi:hypothetical protein SteCoe_7678 [Stentor coeruleus]|uniref:Uncharacterized protein n=1 Tax=Stentor coeruleus TaxID=5963 RepID=A0A1R2CLW5_9CILI|nr:hypothetical protein SteCoe_7678 [Stentor coeruleus]
MREPKIFACILGIFIFMIISSLYILNTSNSSPIKNHQEFFLSSPSTISDHNITNLFSSNQTFKNILFIDLIPRTPQVFSKILSIKLDQYRKYTNQNLTCKPKIYGYSIDQASYFFKPKEFSDCSKNLNPIKNIVNNTIELECPLGYGEYLTSYGKEYEFFGRYNFKAKWIPFNNTIFVDLEDKEFAMIKCSDNVKQAFLMCKFLPDAYKRAKDIAEKIAENVGMKDYKPLGVHVIIMDSVSRQHFYRNFAKTVDYLNERIVGSDDLVMYDFMINNVQGRNTRPNLVAMLFGRLISEHIKEVGNFSKNETVKNESFKRLQEERAIWKYYERLGYVTFFGFETMWTFFAADTGKYVYTDHNVLSFWNAAKTVFGFTDFIQKQRCFGNKNAHMYLLDYLYQFIKKYKGVNKFSYMHFPEAHEDSGSVIKLVDKEFKEILENIINTYSSTEEDFVIIIASDHGRGVNEWDLSDEGFFENTSSFQILITKQDLIQRMGPQTHEILTHNTDRIVGRFDWYISYLHLASFPYGNLPIDSQAYKDIKSSTPSDKALSLFLEKIPNERTCEDLLIPSHYCQCRDFEPLDINSEIIQKLAIPLINSTID